MICGATTRSGGSCQKHAIDGRTRCRLHGGASPRGEDHWNYKHGWYTKETRLRAKKARYELKIIEQVMHRLGMIAD